VRLSSMTLLRVQRSLYGYMPAVMVYTAQREHDTDNDNEGSREAEELLNVSHFAIAALLGWWDEPMSLARSCKRCGGLNTLTSVLGRKAGFGRAGGWWRRRRRRRRRRRSRRCDQRAGYSTICGDSDGEREVEALCAVLGSNGAVFIVRATCSRVVREGLSFSQSYAVVVPQ